MDQEILKLGIAGIVCAILIWQLNKSEGREAKKDTRIQMLENELRESYGERVEAADRISDALHGHALASNNAAIALQHLTTEVKDLKVRANG